MTWRFGPLHSYVRWSCTYLGLLEVIGLFREVHASVCLEGPDVSRWSIVAAVYAAHIDSGHALRDEILRGPDFLDAERFPLITFRSSRVEQRGDAYYRVVGELTLHGVTREVVLDLEDRGEMLNWLGQRSRVLTAETTLQRTDFQVGPPPLAGELISSDVRVRLQVELLWETSAPAGFFPLPQRADSRPLCNAA